MLLYIVRHAYAGQHGDPRYRDDALRPLTTKGRRRFRRAIKKLAKRNFAPSLVATSPLVRCAQTAEVIVERVWPRPELAELDSLRPGGPLEPLVAWTNQQGIEQVAWVGHAPDVDELAAALLGAPPESIEFGKGAIAAIDFANQVVVGQGKLVWYVTPKILGR